MEGTSPTCNDSLKAKPKTKTKLTDEEYWKMKRAKNREKAKDNKRKFETKALLSCLLTHENIGRVFRK